MFQMHAERILKLQQLAAEEALGEDAKVTCPLRWYVMTSPFTDASTRCVVQWLQSAYDSLWSRFIFVNCLNPSLMSVSKSVCNIGNTSKIIAFLDCWNHRLSFFSKVSYPA